MYQGKHVKKTNKPAVLAASLVLALVVAVGGTLAFLSTNTEDVVNTFTPASVPPEIHETFDGKTKSEVKIENTGEVDAYIRAAVIVNWLKLDADGNVESVLGEQPVLGTDYTVSPEDPENGWVLHTDGYYYYTSAVKPGYSTGNLFDSITQEQEKTGYELSVEILAQSIQADGVASDGVTKPVVDAWGVDPENLK